MRDDHPPTLVLDEGSDDVFVRILDAYASTTNYFVVHGAERRKALPATVTAFSGGTIEYPHAWIPRTWLSQWSDSAHFHRVKVRKLFSDRSARIVHHRAKILYDPRKPENERDGTLHW